jgi:hypothetical protein
MDTDLQEDKRAKFLEGLNAGKSVKEMIVDLGIPKSTAYQWRSARKDEHDEEQAPDILAPPAVDAAPRGKRGSAKRGRLTVKPISEETAGILISGLFFVPALFTDEELWLLTPTQKQMLAGPFADSLHVIPAPVADAINTYSAPAVFMTSLGAVIKQKMNEIAKKKRAGFTAPPPPAPPFELRAVPPQFVGAPPTPEPPRSAPAAPQIKDIASAFDAARASLQHLDETDDGAAAFG